MPAQARRGGCLSAFLLVIVLTNAALVVYYAYAGLVFRTAWQSVPVWEVVLRTVVSAGNVAFALAVWGGKRWGVVGLAATAFVPSLLAPDWATVAHYRLWSWGPLLSVSAVLGVGLLHALAIRLLLVAPTWTARSSAALAGLCLGYILLSYVPALAVWPFGPDEATSAALGLLSAALLAALVRRN
jgi:hypothetical protein